jgi:hypothetical protein
MTKQKEMDTEAKALRFSRAQQQFLSYWLRTLSLVVLRSTHDEEIRQAGRVLVHLAEAVESRTPGREKERCESPSRWRSAMAFWMTFHTTQSVVYYAKIGHEDFAAEHVPELLREVRWARDRAEKLVSTLEQIQAGEARQRDAHPVRSGGRAKRTEGGDED